MDLSLLVGAWRGGPMAVLLALWVPAALGWVLVARGLLRRPAGTARKSALIAHVLTPVALALLATQAGYGHLSTVTAASAEWWGLLLVTRGRPGRLLDPGGGALGLLAGWLAVTALLLVALTRVLSLSLPAL